MGPGRLTRALFCDPPRNPRGVRWLQVVSRTVHVAAMGLLLGGLAYGITVDRLHWPIVLTVSSGLALLGLELIRSWSYLYSGAGLGLWLKLALLGLGHVFVPARYELYLASTLVASVASHMPRTWRHVLLWRRGPHAV